jgi:hypothetical protein
MPTKTYNKGIEKIPIANIVTEFKIVVFIVNLETEDVVDQIELDYSRTAIDDKRRLGQLTYWALANGYYLEIMNKKDIDKPYVEDK